MPGKLSVAPSSTLLAQITSFMASLVDTIASADVAFWFGDLNYRLDDIPGDDVRRLPRCILRIRTTQSTSAEGSRTPIFRHPS